MLKIYLKKIVMGFSWLRIINKEEKNAQKKANYF